MTRRKTHKPAVQARAAATLLPLGALAAGFGLASAALAQTAPAAEPAKTETALPVVRAKASTERAGKDDYQATETRIGKGKQELRDIPQSVTVVTERLIDDRNLDTLKDALKNTAGISFQAAEGGEEDIRLRGFSLQSTGDIFIDGMRDPAFYERDTFNYDRLEVLRGSASMLFGRGSTGGAVNQVNKLPLLINQGEVAVTGGQGGYFRVVGDANMKTGEDAAFRVSTMVTEADNRGNKISKQGVAPSFRWGIGTADEFLVSFYYLDNNNGVHYGMPWLTPGPTKGGDRLIHIDPKNYYGAASDYSKSSVAYGTIGHVHRFLDGGELRTQFRAATYDRDLRASAIRFAGAASQPDRKAVTSDTISNATVLTRGSQAKIQDMDTQYLQSDYSGKFGWFGLKHDVTAGLELAHEDFKNYGVPALAKPTTTIGNPNDGGSANEAARPVTLNRTFDAKGQAAYVQNLLQLTPQWKLLGGLRWDRFEGTYHNIAVNPGNNICGVPVAAKVSRSDSLWSKRAGVLFQPTAAQSYHFSYGTSFNTSGDTYQYDAGTANVDPESSRNIELGGKLDWAEGRYTTRFALFRATKYNERNRDSETVNACNYVLSGERHASGLEFDIAGRITPEWEIFASYAYIPNAKVDKASAAAAAGEAVGSRPGLTPRHSGTIWTTYKVTPALRLGLGLNARSGDTPQLAPATWAPKFITADLMAEYTVDKLSFKANLTNISNKLYADMLYRGHYIPGKGRDLQMTVAYKF
ncbi:TonB-dependent receptor [Roseateles sp. DAIF2]|uniref:TonB-dependent receptor n=1 Tax=Roseateles sp. DAIF2 TaxID=2714952 RepID=UPI0018A28B44|nr:TonB-dependent receptor [Roseateles sp. DAIF2]QPF76063.1 TonB-dependent receptor [Roseateles sp. DAIF2]